MDIRINSLDEATKKKARVILRPDGYVHIAFDSSTSIQATRQAVLELIQDPMGFMEEGCLRYKETTTEICRNANRIIPLDHIPGLDLAYVTVQRQVVCDFTELFSGLFGSIGNPNMDEPLNMWDMVCDSSKTMLSDDKALLLRYYLEVSKFLAEKEFPPVKRFIRLLDEVKLAVLQVALSSFGSTKQKENKKPPSVSERLNSLVTQTASPVIPEDDNKDSNWIGTKECSEILGITKQQVRNRIKNGEIKAKQDATGHFLIDKHSLVIKQGQISKKQAKQVKLAGSYEEVQRIIQENGYFTEAVAPYITSMTEMMFFAKSHREVVIDGRPALLLDIHPEYVSKDGRTNRQLINANESPVCPDSPDEKQYHVHHMARRADAPFAIVSTEDHQAYNKIFHQTPKDPNMNRAIFDMQRISFWKSYLQLYDEYGYDRIPYLNKPIDMNPK